MKYPSNWKISKLPKEIIIRSSLWYYKKSVKVNGNTILYTRHLELKVPKISRKVYNEFKNFIDRVIEADSELIHFIADQKKNKTTKESL